MQHGTVNLIARSNLAELALQDSVGLSTVCKCRVDYGEMWNIRGGESGTKHAQLVVVQQ